MANAAHLPEDPLPGRKRGGARTRPAWHWPVATLVAVLVHGAAFTLLGINTTSREVTRPRAQGVNWVGERSGRAHGLIGEALDLLDPAPLFLPTRWNFATRDSDASEEPGSGEIFSFEAPTLSVPEAGSPPGLVEGPKDAATAAMAISLFSRPYFSAFGLKDVELRRLPERLALLEVRSAARGELIMTQEVPQSAAGDAAPWPLWEPFEVLLAVEATGALGPPLVPAPGWQAEPRADVIDDFVRSYLRYEFRPDLRLPAGYYRVVIGP